MKYTIKVSDLKKGFDFETADNLGRKIRDNVHGVTCYSLGFSVEDPELGFEHKTRKATSTLLSFLGNFDPSKVLTEVCREGYVVKESKVRK